MSDSSSSSDGEPTLEQREEARLMRALNAKKRVAKPAAKQATPAPAPAAEPQAAKARSGDMPEWKKRQLAQEEETRIRLEAEAKAKQAQLSQRTHDTSVDVTPMSPRFEGKSDEHKKQEKVLVDWMQGKKVSTATAQAAADAEKERLESIFKAQPKSQKKRFGDVSAQAKKNMEAANQQREIENSRLQKEAAEREKSIRELQSTRVQAAATKLQEASAHYESDNSKALFLNDFEKAVVDEVTALRNDPKAYIAKLRQRRMCYDGKVVTLEDNAGPTIRIKTNEGVAAVDAAIEKLSKATAAPIQVESGLTRAMFKAVQKEGRPNAVASVADFGKVSGSARQLVYRGPIVGATDVVLSILIDDGEPNRSRCDALLADKFKHFGVAGNMDEKGSYNYCYLLLLSNFEENK